MKNLTWQNPEQLFVAQELINKVKSKCCGIKAYDAVTEYHIVEVKPEEIRRGNADYKKMEMQLWMDFMEQYPDECLLICAPSNDIFNRFSVKPNGL